MVAKPTFFMYLICPPLLLLHSILLLTAFGAALSASTNRMAWAFLAAPAKWHTIAKGFVALIAMAGISVACGMAAWRLARIVTSVVASPC